ncbi:MAG TPA: AroM protein [Clostridiales bacterium]|nr:AroM protein [Clostridiales bacterium]
MMVRRSTVRLVTIGQSPRGDIMSVLGRYMPEDVEAVEVGLLDDVDPRGLADLAPRPGEEVLVTRLRDGREVRLGKERITPRLLDLLEETDRAGAEVVVLLCTEVLLPPGGPPLGTEVPDRRPRALLIQPGLILAAVVRSVASGRSLGVLVPAPEQTESARERWAGAGRSLEVQAASPYGGPEALEAAAAALARAGPDLVVMDCMGFGPEHKRIVQSTARCPVVLAASLVGRTMAELLS